MSGPCHPTAWHGIPLWHCQCRLEPGGQYLATASACKHMVQYRDPPVVYSSTFHLAYLGRLQTQNFPPSSNGLVVQHPVHHLRLPDTTWITHRETPILHMDGLHYHDATRPLYRTGLRCIDNYSRWHCPDLRWPVLLIVRRIPVFHKLLNTQSETHGEVYLELAFWSNVHCFPLICRSRVDCQSH